MKKVSSWWHRTCLRYNIVLPRSQLRARMHLEQETLLMVLSVGAAVLLSWVAALQQSMKTPLFSLSPTRFTGCSETHSSRVAGTITPIICPVALTTPKRATHSPWHRVPEGGTNRVPQAASGGRSGEWCDHQIKEQDNHKQTYIYNMYSGHGCICTVKENITF